jgi:Stress responsive A/B Barrel Domain
MTDLLDAAPGPIVAVQTHRNGDWTGLLLDHETGARSEATLCSTVAAEPLRIELEVLGPDLAATLDVAAGTGPEFLGSILRPAARIADTEAFATLRRELAETVTSRTNHPLGARRLARRARRGGGGGKHRTRRRACRADRADRWTAMIVHVVLLRLNQGATERQLAALEEAIRALPRSIYGIGGVGSGPNASPERRGGGFHRGFVITFADADSRGRYLSHPAHLRVVEQIREIADEVLVYDIDEST